MLQKIHPSRNSNINSFIQATNKDGMCDWQFGRMYLMLAWILDFSGIIFKFMYASYFQKNQLFIGCANKRGLVKKKRPKPMTSSDSSHSSFFASPFFLRWGGSGGKSTTSYWQHSNCWSGPIRSYIANEAPNIEAGHGLCKPIRP